jgi:hypothetical protein
MLVLEEEDAMISYSGQQVFQLQDMRARYLKVQKDDQGV